MDQITVETQRVLKNEMLFTQTGTKGFKVLIWTDSHFQACQTERGTERIFQGRCKFKISFHVFGNRKSPNIAVLQRLETEHAIATTLISELAHPLLSSLAIGQEEPDSNRKPTDCKKIPRQNFNCRWGNPRGNHSLA